MRINTGVRNILGFTVIELVIAMMLLGVVTSIAIPRASEALQVARVDRASRSVAIDLEQAIGLAARQRSPITIQQPAGSREIVVEDAGDATVFWTTDLGDGSRIATSVETLELSPSSVNVFPTGQTSAALTVTVTAGEHSRTITMSQAGQIRVVP